MRDEPDPDETEGRDVAQAAVEREADKRVERDTGEERRDGGGREVHRQGDQPVALDRPGARFGEHRGGESAGRADERDGEDEADEGRGDLQRALPLRCSEEAHQRTGGEHERQRSEGVLVWREDEDWHASREGGDGGDDGRPAMRLRRHDRHGETLRPPRNRRIEAWSSSSRTSGAINRSAKCLLWRR